MIHIRAVCPTDVTPRLLESLGANDGVVNLVVLEGVARNPAGDSLQFDVITAEANRVLDELRRLELDRRGSIVIENIDTSISELAAQAERREPTKANFSPIWEEAEARIRERGTYRPSWYALLAIAGIIGAVGILTNSQILIVGAMVVGPEYGAMIGVALGIDQRDGMPIRRGLNALLFGFALAIAVTLVFSLLIRAFDLQPRAYELGIRPVADLIDSPNAFSVIVAVLAGIVGVVSLTEARASTLIGVFVSVTTIPAAADMGLSMAFGDWSEARGAFLQLVVNVVILIVVGAIGLAVQRRIWGRTGWWTGTR
ncbi:MAG TPA: DUF389 domain-containing protein [Acidimicrobiia bacterium]|nr:DUF389 domain-containing protein [Acidimicrobiia bacterium]